ncbi:MAG: hypothetical protein DDT32_01193 [Syntrophomonadaceae bacterium]|nr:hypothetical protein [Bacillota bacterium]
MCFAMCYSFIQAFLEKGAWQINRYAITPPSLARKKRHLSDTESGRRHLAPSYTSERKRARPLPSLVDRKVAKHTKGDKDGVKAERRNIRVLPKGGFTRIESIENLYVRLFSKA